MNIFLSVPSILLYGVLSSICFLSIPPYTVSASHTNPTCTLVASTTVGKVELKKSNTVFLNKNDILYIEWESNNAKKATDTKGKTILLSGVATSSPLKKTTFEYTFTSGSKNAVCEMSVIPVNATISSSSLATDESKPLLTGKAIGTKTIQFKIFKSGSKKVLYTSKRIKVKNGKWSSRISKTLPDGLYDVIVYADANVLLNTITTGTLTVGAPLQSNNKVDTTFIVRSVPLLSGGIAHGGGIVAVSYLQITNIGKESATLKGFTLKQNSSASVDAVVGLTSVDDTGVFKGSVGGILGPTPFKNGLVYVPISPMLLLAGQTHLFTLKAIVSKNIALHVGKQLKLDVSAVDTNAKIAAVFPIYGTTWTIAY